MLGCGAKRIGTLRSSPMRRAELARALAGGPVIVDCVMVDGCPGHVRTVTLYPDHRVNVELEVWGMDEGGLYFWAQFPDREAAVAYLEGYLGRAFTSWRSCTDVYPPRPVVDSHDAHRILIRALSEQRVSLPEPSLFCLSNGDWWRQFLPFPSLYRGCVGRPWA